MKHGIACSYYLFGLLGPFGSPKLTSAIEDAGISKVAVVDYSGGYYLLVSRECIEVYGE